MSDRGYIALAISLIFLTFFVYSVSLFGWNTFEQLALHNQSYGVAVAIGNSMYPTIKNGAIIVYVKENNVKIGDIVLYDATLDPRYLPWIKPNEWFEHIVIAHRVIEVTELGYVVKGDNNPLADPWFVKKDQIIGKAVVWFNDPLNKIIAIFWLKIFGYAK